MNETLPDDCSRESQLGGASALFPPQRPVESPDPFLRIETFMRRTTLVVPCYNEAQRLNVAAFIRFAQDSAAHLILVNDGSRDETLRVLEGIRDAAPTGVRVVDLPRNSGKAEAVRQGMLEALNDGAEFVGFWDADLATPFDALSGFVEQLEARPHLEVVMGSRVRLLGRTIDRDAKRHYAGRAFATAVSLALRLPVYDTQCGAKLFRATERLRQALAQPFVSRWVFDVELLARLGSTSAGYSPELLVNTVCENPLMEWRDVAGSKLRMVDFAKSGLDLVRIHRAYVRRRGVQPTHTAESAERVNSHP
jgi:glycosyltransferase involved in cell wall biosynthesis